MSKDLLLEIGTEEIPARFMPGILAQIEESARKKFVELRIGCGEIKAFGTPRRIALIVESLQENQEDITAENKGPSVKIAFDGENNPTKAALGFARGQKVDVKDLLVKDGYIYAAVHERGGRTEELLPGVLSQLITGLSFPKNMRWADLDMKFVRPIKWLVALFGDKVVDFTIAEVRSGNISRGHRFLGGEVKITEPASYVEQMEQEFVLVDQDRRRDLIRRQIEALAAQKGGMAEITEELLEEVVYLVEYPTALCGNFEEKYLKLPPETVITPMREHQRYFPVKSADGKLLPLFITVRNGGAEHLETVQRGNERVLRARLADAQFFFEEDCKVKLIDRLDKLKTIVFQDGLGTMYDKVLRIEELAAFLGGETGVDAALLPVVRRTAKLAKTDLVTGMVCEFTELQGIMGREYALLNGEEEAVAEGIYEHYLPRFSGDALAETVAGRLVGIADKLDNIVATFSRGLIPTGSQDPYALRRQALGIVHTLLHSKCNVSLRILAGKAMDLLAINDEEKRDSIIENLKEFFLLRMKNVLADEKIRYDVVDAVLAVESDKIHAAYLKAKAVAKQIEAETVQKAIQAFVRAGNIAKKAQSSTVQESLFVEAVEKDLYQAYQNAQQEVCQLLQTQEYVKAIETLTGLTAPIDAFFEKVMVMDKDLAVQKNRLALLRNVVDLSQSIADFSKIV